MSKSSHLELHDTDSEVLGLLDSVSLPSEPPDIRHWFSSYIYESPELDKLDGFEDSDGAGETCLEENTRKSGNNHPASEYDISACAGHVKSSHRIESNGSECCKSAAMVPGLSESFLFSAEPPDIRNWFSSYIYESPLLDTAHDFAISVCKEREDGELYVVEKRGSQSIKDPMASISVEKFELSSLKNTSDAVVKGPNLVKGSKLDYQSVCKDDDDNDITLQPLPSIPSLSSTDKVSEPMLCGQKAGYSNHKSLEKIGSTNAHSNDYDAKLHSTISSRNPRSSYMENNIGSQDAKSVYWSTEGTDRIKDGLGNKDIYNIVSPQTIDRIVPKGDLRGSQADRRSTGKENEETELLEDGFISVRKKCRQENAETVGRLRIEVERMTNNEKDANNNIVRKVLSEITNFHSQNIMGSTGKWSCPQKNKTDLDPPLKQLRLDQWVRRF